MRTRWSARSEVMSSPSKMIFPEWIPRTPLTARMVEVLPAPLAPIRVTISPSATSSEIPCRASILP